MNRARTKRSKRRSTKKVKSSITKPPRRSFAESAATPENPKLAALIRRHFTAKGRAERIVRGQKALRRALEIGATFKELDAETIKKIAEDPGHCSG